MGHLHRIGAAMCRLHASGRHNVFAASIAVFLALNLIENFLHYSIGRRSSADSGPGRGGGAPLPTARDAALIGTVMLVFAVLQGALTWALTRRF